MTKTWFYFKVCYFCCHIILKLIQCLGLKDLNDKTEFSKLQMEHINTIIRFKLIEEDSDFKQKENYLIYNILKHQYQTMLELINIG